MKIIFLSFFSCNLRFERTNNIFIGFGINKFFFFAIAQEFFSEFFNFSERKIFWSKKEKNLEK